MTKSGVNRKHKVNSRRRISLNCHRALRAKSLIGRISHEPDILVSLEEVMHGSERALSLQRPAANGRIETRNVRIRIPKGITTGQFIRCAGLGEPGIGGAPDGDLFLRVHLERHPYLRVEGFDLYYELPLAPWEAVLGAEVEIPALGRKIRVRVPANTESGTELRIAGKGLPTGADGTHGHLFAVVDIVTPPAAAEEEKALWRKLEAASSFRPRN